MDLLGLRWGLSRRPSVFHSTYYTLPALEGLRSVVTVHDFVDRQFPAFSPNGPGFVRIQEQAIASADALIAVSEATRKAMISLTSKPRSSISVIPHGVSSHFQPRGGTVAHKMSFAWNYTGNRPYWLFVGKRTSYKNFGTLLRAFAKVAQRDRAHCLVVVGGKAKLEPYQDEFIIETNIEDRVIVLPVVDEEILRDAYIGATAFIYPSLAEGFGIPILEAMACGTPVIASDIPVFREVAGCHALFFDPHNIDDLSRLLTESIDYDYRADFAGKGIQRAAGFSWEDAALQQAYIYRTLSHMKRH